MSQTKKILFRMIQIILKEVVTLTALSQAECSQVLYLIKGYQILIQLQFTQLIVVLKKRVILVEVSKL